MPSKTRQGASQERLARVSSRGSRGLRRSMSRQVNKACVPTASPESQHSGSRSVTPTGELVKMQAPIQGSRGPEGP